MINAPMFSAKQIADKLKTRDKFYELEQEVDMKWQKRLLSLSIDDQLKISKKYYGGSMPWNEE